MSIRLIGRFRGAVDDIHNYRVSVKGVGEASDVEMEVVTKRKAE